MCEFARHRWYVLGGGEPEFEQPCICGAFRWRNRRAAFQWQHDMTWWAGERC